MTLKQVVRLSAALVGLVGLLACNDHPIATPIPRPTGTVQNFIAQNLNSDLDILFEIDNSGSMANEQANLVANFPVFINVLKGLPAGLPNVHIGVVTSDMGAGASTVGSCNNDHGNFIAQPRVSGGQAPCTTAQLNTGEHFIVSTGNGTQNNFTGDITDVFRCLAQVGTNGCGYEMHLESVRAALGDMGDPAHDIPMRTVPAGNAGFLRPEAFLAVIFITNEEECSTPDDSALWDQNATATLGPNNDRCFAHTDVCDGQLVLNYVNANAAAGPFMTCVPDETTFSTDPTHAPIPVQYYIDYFQRVKANPNKVLLSGVIAPPGPYSIVTGNGGVEQGNSCTGNNGVFGQPAPRWAKFFGAFGPQQAVTASICDRSYAGAMQLIGELIGRKLGSPCVDGVIADRSTSYTSALGKPQPGQVVDSSKYSCTVEDIQDLGTPQQKSAGELQPCNPQGQAGACFALVGDNACGISGAKIVLCRNGFDPAQLCLDGPNMAPDNDTAIVRCATIP